MAEMSSEKTIASALAVDLASVAATVARTKLSLLGLSGLFVETEKLEVFFSLEISSPVDGETKSS